MIGKEGSGNDKEDNESVGTNTHLNIDIYYEYTRGNLRREGML